LTRSLLGATRKFFFDFVLTYKSLHLIRRNDLVI